MPVIIYNTYVRFKYLLLFFLQRLLWWQAVVHHLHHLLLRPVGGVAQQGHLLEADLEGEAAARRQPGLSFFSRDGLI